MAETSIEWTDATWNPVAGCTVLTAGCTNCYAMRMAARLEAMGTAKYRGLTRKSGRAGGLDRKNPVWIMRRSTRRKRGRSRARYSSTQCLTFSMRMCRSNSSLGSGT